MPSDSGAGSKGTKRKLDGTLAEADDAETTAEQVRARETRQERGADARFSFFETRLPARFDPVFPPQVARIVATIKTLAEAGPAALDRPALRRATHALADLAKSGTLGKKKEGKRRGSMGGQAGNAVLTPRPRSNAPPPPAAGTRWTARAGGERGFGNEAGGGGHGA